MDMYSQDPLPKKKSSTMNRRMLSLDLSSIHQPPGPTSSNLISGHERKQMEDLKEPFELDTVKEHYLSDENSSLIKEMGGTSGTLQEANKKQIP